MHNDCCRNVCMCMQQAHTHTNTLHNFVCTQTHAQQHAMKHSAEVFQLDAFEPSLFLLSSLKLTCLGGSLAHSSPWHYKKGNGQAEFLAVSTHRACEVPQTAPDPSATDKKRDKDLYH